MITIFWHKKRIRTEHPYCVEKDMFEWCTKTFNSTDWCRKFIVPKHRPSVAQYEYRFRRYEDYVFFKMRWE